MKQLFEKAQEAAEYIRYKTNLDSIQTGMVLGTGMSGFYQVLEDRVELAYSNIPYFPVSTVKSHAGKLILGRIQDKVLAVLAGRFHYYEGYDLDYITFPVRVLHLLGVQELFLTNAAGSTNADYAAGDIALIRDHINLLPGNPLRGKNDERFGPRFPDMMEAYDAGLRQKALEYAARNSFQLHQAVYVALQGPNLETPSEYGFIHRIGGDLVGMSTVPEVIVARHMEMKVCAFSIVSNECYPPEKIRPTTIDSVIEVVTRSEARMQALLQHMVAG